MSKFQKTTLATALLLVTAQSSAAGFQVSEHSASGLGRAFAGEAAVADNARKAIPAIPTLNIFFIGIVISTN